MRKTLPDFTDNGRKLFSDIMVTLGKKTKLQFVDSLIEEFDDTFSDDHQMLNSGDVARIADKLNLSYKPCKEK